MIVPRHLILLPVVLTAHAAQQLQWSTAIGAATTGPGSVLHSIVAIPDDGVIPARAFACGEFLGNFNIGPGAPFTNNAAGLDGIVVRFQKNGNWDVGWRAQATSSGDVHLLDVAISPLGNVWVCGTYTQDLQLGDSGVGFSNAGGPHGFVAQLDASNGNWLDAFETPGILPVSLALDGFGGGVVSGPGTLATAFDGLGNIGWSVPAPAAVVGWSHVVIDPSGESAYVMVKRTGSAQEVGLARIDIASGGGTDWIRWMGSAGQDEPGGLDVGPDGEVRLTFSADHPTPEFDGQPVPGTPFAAVAHTIAARIRSNGTPRWLKPLGIGASPSSLVTHDLDCDAHGNAWVAGVFDGSILFEGQNEAGNNDFALVAIDGAGTVYDFHRTSGTAMEEPLGVAAPGTDTALVVGRYTGSGSTFVRSSGVPPTLSAATNETAFFAAVETVPNQTLTVFHPGGPLTLAGLITAIESVGGQVYAVAESPAAGVAVSAWVTASQLADIVANPNVSAEQESFLTPNGTSTNAGWALARLNDPSVSSSATYNYTAPDTPGEVVLHLIDTGVEDPGSWFSANPNLVFESATVIRGAGDPTESSLFEHGTQMLSLIAGPNTGSATGTPIRLHSYDIYPRGSISTSALLADAILEAVRAQENEHGCRPGLICIASSSTAIATSRALDIALEVAYDAGLPVVLSAGNSAADAARYVPQRYAGSGVLCVGASGSGNTPWRDSNFGTPVDLHAPGEGVRIVAYPDALPGTYDSFSGSSASSAFAAGIVAVHLSVNPWQSPAQVEASVVEGAHPDKSGIKIAQMPASGPVFSSSFQNWAVWHGVSTPDFSADTDGDGLSDGMEFVLGYGFCASSPSHPLTVALDAGVAEVSFQLDAVLFDTSNPSILRDGTTWELALSHDLETWEAAGDAMIFGETENGRVPVTLRSTLTDEPCFYRLEVTPSP